MTDLIDAARQPRAQHADRNATLLRLIPKLMAMKAKAAPHPSNGKLLEAKHGGLVVWFADMPEGQHVGVRQGELKPGKHKMVFSGYLLPFDRFDVVTWKRGEWEREVLEVLH